MMKSIAEYGDGHKLEEAEQRVAEFSETRISCDLLDPSKTLYSMYLTHMALLPAAFFAPRSSYFFYNYLTSATL